MYKVIEWKKYPENQPISHINYLITEGSYVWTGFHASNKTYGYSWYDPADNDPMYLGITHFAEINLP